MTPCLDIHTHHPAPQPYGVVSATLEDFNPVEGQRYSLGVHPWTVKAVPDRAFWEEFERKASHPSVVAIGECGIDRIKGAPLFIQMIVFKQQILISEKLGKPMVIHDVKAHDQILGMRKDGDLRQNWVIHGFRGKPTIGKMYTDAGIYLSFGEKYNPETLKSMPRGLILSETDESSLTIQEVISNLSATLNGGEPGQTTATTEMIESNTKVFLNISTEEY